MHLHEIINDDWIHVEKTYDLMWDEYVKYSEAHNTALKRGQDQIANNEDGDPYEIADAAADEVLDEFNFLLDKPFGINSCPAWMSSAIKGLLLNLTDEERKSIHEDLFDATVEGLT